MAETAETESYIYIQWNEELVLWKKLTRLTNLYPH